MSNQGWTQNDSFDNWDDVSDAAPKPLEAGFYLATIGSAKAEPTTKGKPAIKIELSATHVFQGDELPSPRKLYDTKPITVEAAGLVKNLCTAAQVDPPRSNNFEAVSGLADSLLGQVVIIKTKLESYVKDGEKKTVARVERYYTQEAAEHAKSGVAPAASDEAAPVQGRRRRGPAAAGA